MPYGPVVNKTVPRWQFMCPVFEVFTPVLSILKNSFYKLTRHQFSFFLLVSML